jgi:hypothetical protein
MIHLLYLWVITASGSGRRLCASHQGRSRGMPHRLLSVLPRQSNRAGHPPPLVGRGGLAGRTVSSPRHGQGTEEVESLKMPNPKSRKTTKTNIAPPTWRARCRVVVHEHQGTHPLCFLASSTDEMPLSPQKAQRTHNEFYPSLGHERGSCVIPYV